MKRLLLVLILSFTAQAADTLSERTQRYLIDLIKLDTTNPPGNETRVANYLKKIADAEGIPSELLGANPAPSTFSLSN